MIARWVGEIDAGNADEVQAAALEGLQEGDAGLTIDLSGVTYVDSAGIRVLTVLKHELAERHQRLRLVVPERSVLGRALEVGGVSSVIPTFVSLSAARQQD